MVEAWPKGHVIGVEHVLDLELPIAAIGVPVHAGIERERAVGGAVDEIVDIALHRPDMVLEARTFRRQTREHEAAICADARRMSEAEGRFVEIAAQPSGTGTAASRPSVSKLQP